jgi:hypothetical protein
MSKYSLWDPYTEPYPNGQIVKSDTNRGYRSKIEIGGGLIRWVAAIVHHANNEHAQCVVEEKVCGTHRKDRTTFRERNESITKGRVYRRHQRKLADFKTSSSG